MARLALLNAFSHVDELWKNGDKHTIDNLDCSGEYLWSSMDSPLLTKFLAPFNGVSSRTEILMALILVICASNFEILDKVKDKLVNAKLSGFPG